MRKRFCGGSISKVLFCLALSSSLAGSPPLLAASSDDDDFQPYLIYRGSTAGPVCTLTSPATTAAVGSTLTLTATCSGQGPFTYTWTGPGVTGGTSTTTINNVQIVTQTAGTTETYGVVAKSATLQGPRATIAIQVTANTAPSASWVGIPGPATVLSPYQTTPISVQLVDPDPYQTRDVVFWVNGVAQPSSPNANGVWTYNWTPTGSGVYVIQAQGHDYTQARSQLLTTTITVEDPPSATQLSIPGTSTVGATGGSFGVTDSGAATYSMPLAVPPGIAGLQPSLALSYNSQGGDGMLGMGWAVSGLPVISRCQRTEATDGRKQQISYSASTTDNVYCLDGQRLIWVGSGTDNHGNWNEFRTEIDSYSRIRSYGDTFSGGVWQPASADYGNITSPVIGGPARFEIRTKSGQILHFAYRNWVVSNGNGQTARYNSLKVWPLDRVEDRAGNFMEVDYCGKQGTRTQSNGAAAGFVPFSLADYCNPNGVAPPQAGGTSPAPAIGAYPGTQFEPSEIRYGNNAGTFVGKVDFSYSSRDVQDQFTAYDSGAGQAILAVKLDSIQMSSLVNGAMAAVKRYNLSYETSPISKRLRLLQVQECADASSSTCLAPTTFAWPASNGVGFASTRTSLPIAANVDPERIADLDGDGRSDVIRLNVSAVQPTFDVCLSGAGGFSCGTWPTSIAPGSASQWWLGDFNGDGLVDVAFTYDDGTGSYQTVATCYSTGSKFLPCVTNDVTGTPVSLARGSDPAFQADLNGDGRIDFAFYTGNGMWKVYLSKGQAFAAPIVVGPLVLPGMVGTDIQHEVVMADVDGDGRADWILRRTNNDNDTTIDSSNGVPYREEWFVCFSNFQPGDVAQPASPVNCATNYVRLVPSQVNTLTVADFNGDGLADVAAPVPFDSTSNPDPGSGALTRPWRICLSTGDGAFNCSTYSGPNSRDYGGRLAVTNTVFGDFNGDGRTDYAALVSNASQWLICTAKGRSPSSAGLTTTDALVDFDCSSPGGLIPGQAETLLSGDFNGDGRTDLEATFSVANTQALVTGAEAIGTITNGLGATISVTYGPLTDGNVYTKSDPAHPVSLEDSRSFLIQSPLYVVKKTSASTGAGANYDTAYQYESLVGRTTGRGLMGFGRKVVTESVADDSAYRVQTSTDFNVRWPIMGRPSKVVRTVGTSAVVTNESDFDWECLSPAAVSGCYGAPGGSMATQVVLVQKTDKPFEPNSPTNGALPWTVTVTPLANVDANGNIGRVEVYTTDGTANRDGYDKLTTSQYLSEDTANWIIGRVTSTSVQSYLPDGSSLIRSSGFAYFSAADGPKAGLLKSETIEPQRTGSLTMTTTYDYDSYGNRISATKQFSDGTNSRTTTTSFDGNGRFVASIRNALNQTETRTYDARFGGVATSTDPNGLTLSTSYDAFGRKVSEALFDSASRLMSHTTWTLSAEGSGYMVETATNTGGGSRMHYDNLGREIAAQAKTFRGTFVGSSTTYDSKGRKATVTRRYADSSTTNPAGTDRATAWTYDVAGRVTQEADYPGTSTTGTPTRTTTIAHSVVSERDLAATSGAVQAPLSVVTTTRSNPSGNETTARVSNSQGQVVRVNDALQHDTRFAYDAFGNLICVTPTGTTPSDYRCGTSITGLQVKTSYDERGRKKAITDPDSGSSSYGYNGADELTSQTDAGGNTTTITFDDLGRMKVRTVSGSAGSTTTQWTYDTCKTGKLCRVDRDYGRVVRTFQYDGQARQFLAQLDVDSRTFTTRTLYDTQGRQSLVSYPGDAAGNAGLAVSQAYNAYGYMQGIHDDTDSIPVWSADSRFDDGQLMQSHVGGNIITRTYDTLGRIANINALAPANLTLAYDSLGNLTSRSDSAAGYAEGFKYDKLNRLVNVCSDTGCASVVKTYGYDDVGDITSANGSAYTYYGNTHRVSAALGQSYGYDGNGNVQTVNGATYATWAPFNLPSTLGALQFDYDGQYTRIKQVDGAVTTYYATPGFFEELESGGQVTLRSYIQSPEGPIGVVNLVRDASGNQTSWSLKYWVKDHLGSVIAEIDSQTSAFSRLGYDAWGNRRDEGNGVNGSLFASHRGFTGHEMLDDVALVHMNGRIYNPAIGKFLSPDPIVQDPLNIQNYNRYSYVLNNPLSLTDPTGYSWWTKWRQSIAAVVVSIATYGLASEWMASAAVAEGESTALANVTFLDTEGTVVASGLTTEGTVLAGAAAGFAAGGVMGGNLESGIYGALSGGFMSWVGVASSEMDFMPRVGARTLAAVAVAKANGGNYSHALEFALLTNLALEGYVAGTQQQPTFEPGENVNRFDLPCTDQRANCYVANAETGIPRYFWGRNVFGDNTSFVNTPSGERFAVWQSGPISRVANSIPGMNSLAVLHDDLFEPAPMGIPFNNATNYLTMLPAVAWNYTALMTRVPWYLMSCNLCRH